MSSDSEDRIDASRKRPRANSDFGRRITSPNLTILDRPVITALSPRYALRSRFLPLYPESAEMPPAFHRDTSVKNFSSSVPFQPPLTRSISSSYYSSSESSSSNSEVSNPDGFQSLEGVSADMLDVEVERPMQLPEDAVQDGSGPLEDDSAASNTSTSDQCVVLRYNSDTGAFNQCKDIATRTLHCLGGVYSINISNHSETERGKWGLLHPSKIAVCNGCVTADNILHSTTVNVRVFGVGCDNEAVDLNIAQKWKIPSGFEAPFASSRTMWRICSNCHKPVVFCTRTGGCCQTHAYSRDVCLLFPCTSFPQHGNYDDVELGKLVQGKMRLAKVANVPVCLECSIMITLYDSRDLKLPPDTRHRLLLQLTVASGADVMDEALHVDKLLCTRLRSGIDGTSLLDPIGKSSLGWTLAGKQLKKEILEMDDAAVRNIDEIVASSISDGGDVFAGKQAQDTIDSCQFHLPQTTLLFRGLLQDCKHIQTNLWLMISLVLFWVAGIVLLPLRIISKLVSKRHARMALHWVLWVFGILQKSWSGVWNYQRREVQRVQNDGCAAYVAKVESILQDSGPGTIVFAHADNIDLATGKNSGRGQLLNVAVHQAHATIVLLTIIKFDKPASTLSPTSCAAVKSNAESAIVDVIKDDIPETTHPLRWLRRVLNSHASQIRADPQSLSDMQVQTILLPGSIRHPNSKANVGHVVVETMSLLRRSSSFCRVLKDMGGQVPFVIDGSMYFLFSQWRYDEIRRDLTVARSASLAAFPVIGLFHLEATLFEATLNITGPFGIFVLCSMLGVRSGEMVDALKIHRETKTLFAALIQLITTALRRATVYNLTVEGNMVTSDSIAEFLEQETLLSSLQEDLLIESDTRKRLRWGLVASLRVLLVWLDLHLCMRTGDPMLLRQVLQRCLIVLAADCHTKAVPIVSDTLAMLNSHHPGLCALLRAGGTALSCPKTARTPGYALLGLDEITETMVDDTKSSFGGRIDEAGLVAHMHRLGMVDQAGSDVNVLHNVQELHGSGRGGGAPESLVGDVNITATMPLAISSLVSLLTDEQHEDEAIPPSAAPWLYHNDKLMILWNLFEKGTAVENAKRIFDDSIVLHTSLSLQPISRCDAKPPSGAGLTRVFGPRIRAGVGFQKQKAEKEAKKKAKHKAHAALQRQREAMFSVADAMNDADIHPEEAIQTVRKLMSNIMSGATVNLPQMLADVDGVPRTRKDKSKENRYLVDLLALPSFDADTDGMDIWPGKRLKEVQQSDKAVLIDAIQLLYGNTHEIQFKLVALRMSTAVRRTLLQGHTPIVVFDVHSDTMCVEHKAITENARDATRCVDPAAATAEILMLAAADGRIPMKRKISMDLYYADRKLRTILIYNVAVALFSMDFVGRLLMGSGRRVVVVGVPQVCFNDSTMLTDLPVDTTDCLGIEIDRDGTLRIEHYTSCKHAEADNSAFFVASHFMRTQPSTFNQIEFQSTDTDIFHRCLLLQAVLQTPYDISWNNRKSSVHMIERKKLLLNGYSAAEYKVAHVVAASASGNDYPGGFPALKGWLQALDAFIHMDDQRNIVQDVGEAAGRARFQIQFKPFLRLMNVVLKHNLHTRSALTRYTDSTVIAVDYNTIRLAIMRGLQRKKTNAIDLAQFVPPLLNQAELAVSRMQTYLEYMMSAVIGQQEFTLEDWAAKPAAGTMPAGFVLRDKKLVVYYGKDEDGKELYSV